MGNSAPTIAVVGSGAVGLYYGGRLAQHGWPVHFLLRSDYQRIATTGLKVRSCDGDFSIPPAALHAHRSISTMPPADIVLVALKSTANNTLASLIPSLLKPTTTLITLQNGLGNEDVLAKFAAPPQILGGIAFTCINRTSDGVVDHSAHGLIRLGAFDQGNRNLSEIASLFSACKIECEAINDLIHGRWRKLIWNVPFNGLGAGLDLTTDELLASSTGEKMVTVLMQEIMSAGAALGMSFDDPQGMVRDQLAKTLEMGRYRTSMQLDRHNQRPLELEAIVGEPLRRGVAAGVLMPETARLYDVLLTVDTAIHQLTQMG